MEKEKSLSSKRTDCMMREFRPSDIIYFEDDVKEAVLRLKKFNKADRWTVLEMSEKINEIFGEELSQ